MAVALGTSHRGLKHSALRAAVHIDRAGHHGCTNEIETDAEPEIRMGLAEASPSSTPTPARMRTVAPKRFRTEWWGLQEGKRLGTRRPPLRELAKREVAVARLPSGVCQGVVRT